MAGALGLGAAAESPVSGKQMPQGALSGRNIALWQSHGRYYDAADDRWKWQRCRLFGTVEDLYTRSYVVPLLVPMLENAGAYVMLPRERDEHRQELIIDPDGHFAIHGYHEHNGKHKWQQAPDAGFGYDKQTLAGGDNPFAMGHAREVKTVAPKDAAKASTATWSAPIAEAGEYAVYVSYPALKDAATDARYTVHTATGPREFTVNQRMGAGTWMYLGTFPFPASKSPQELVTLSNVSAAGKAVGADAVRIGGGMGNVGRGEEGQTSGMPRWAEAARYWLQWAGMPDSVYANQESDYRDDIFCRPQWVNYMLQELNIPIDLAMAFHSDAGVTDTDDETIGTLGIYYTYKKKGRYADGRSRLLGGKLCDAIVGSVASDIRAKYDPDWTQRKTRDASYIEARVPEVPTMLLELLSHQNFADMKLGLDPQFKFDVSRAVYKGILKYLAGQKLAKYVVQPLPVNSLALVHSAGSSYMLSWEATADPLEATAAPTSYIIERRKGQGFFEAVDTVSTTFLTVEIPVGEVWSYRVTARNDGGNSFPSEVMAAGSPLYAKGRVLVVNAFTRVSAPDAFAAGPMAGFGLTDPGVPMGTDYSYTGAQYDFDRSSQWVHDDQPGFGASHANMETLPVHGNSFDYVSTHGAAILAAGYAFDSRSVASFVRTADRPDMVDVILGLQRGEMPELQHRLQMLAEEGAGLMVSGAYVATDSRKNSGEFLRRVLGAEWRTDHATVTGEVMEVKSKFDTYFARLSFSFPMKAGALPYCVPSADVIFPAYSSGATIMRYKETLAPAAVAMADSTHRAVTLGFPFEAIETAAARQTIMQQILNFLQ